jgi:hypothetical protein
VIRATSGGGALEEELLEAAQLVNDASTALTAVRKRGSWW